LPVYEVYNIQLFAFKIIHDDACQPILVYTLLDKLTCSLRQQDAAVSCTTIAIQYCRQTADNTCDTACLPVRNTVK